MRSVFTLAICQASVIDSLSPHSYLPGIQRVRPTIIINTIIRESKITKFLFVLLYIVRKDLFIPPLSVAAYLSLSIEIKYLKSSYDQT